MVLSVRLASIEDLDALVRIEMVAFDPSIYPPMSRRSFMHMITRGHGAVLIAEEDGEALGHAVLFFRKTSRKSRLYSIAVDPAYQGGAVGKMLFDRAESYSQELGYLGMALEIRLDNEKHKNRYMQRGYKILCSLPDYYPDGSDGLKLYKDF